VRCGAALGRDAKFCRGCGQAVGSTARVVSEPSRENVVPMPQPAPARAPEPPQEARPSGRHISLTHLDDDLDGGPDYLEAQLGLTASDIPAAPTGPPAWRLGRRPAPVEKAPAPIVEVEKPDVVVPAVPDVRDVPETRRPRERRAPQLSDTPSVAVWGAVGFALIALGIAALVHFFAPSAVAGYSAAEFDLKVQMRAVEWLLAGILVGIVGLLLKR
jgi:hypothetical protein